MNDNLETMTSPYTSEVKNENDRRIVKTKEAIKNQLIELLKTYDINKISITKLTLKAEINRKTFYLHYRNVPAVVTEIENNFYKNLIDLVSKADIYPLESLKVKLFIFDLLSCVTNDKYFLALLMNERYTFKLLSKVNKILAEWIIINFLERSKKQSTLDPKEFKEYKERISFVIKYHVFATIGVFYDVLIETKNNFSIDELTNNLANIILRRMKQMIE